MSCQLSFSMDLFESIKDHVIATVKYPHYVGAGLVIGGGGVVFGKMVGSICALFCGNTGGCVMGLLGGTLFVAWIHDECGAHFLKQAKPDLFLLIKEADCIKKESGEQRFDARAIKSSTKEKAKAADRKRKDDLIIQKDMQWRVKTENLKQRLELGPKALLVGTVAFPAGFFLWQLVRSNK